MIREGRDADASTLIRLIERCWADYPGCVLDVDAEAPELRALATHYQDQGGALWIDAGGAGMVAAKPLGAGAWEICRVYVHPDAHGSGLAQTLLAAAERHAVAAGATELALWTDTRFRRAHRFYEKHSYLRAGPVRALDDIARSVEFRYAKPVHGIRTLDVAAARSAERRLATILQDCVDAGASVSFFAPLAPDRAHAFWQGVTSRVGAGQVILLAAWDAGVLAGTVQLALPDAELGRHRAAVNKLLVHPAHRRRGLASALLAAAEAEAAAAGRVLLELDTRADDAGEPLYRRHGWTEIGRIDGYTRDATGREEATVIFTKRLPAPP